MFFSLFMAKRILAIDWNYETFKALLSEMFNDKFNITVQDSGLINKIKIEHDNSGSALN